MQTKPNHTMHCERCGAVLQDSDFAANTIDLPHDGCWCRFCCDIYFAADRRQFTVTTYRSGTWSMTLDWTVWARSLEEAERVAIQDSARHVNSWVGEWSVLRQVERAA